MYQDISEINIEFKENRANLIFILSVIEGADMVIEQNIRESFNQEYYVVKAILQTFSKIIMKTVIQLLKYQTIIFQNKIFFSRRSPIQNR